MRPCGLQPTRLLCPGDSPGKDTGVGCHALLQWICPTQGSIPCLLSLPALAGGPFTTSATGEAPEAIRSNQYHPATKKQNLVFTPVASDPKAQDHRFCPWVAQTKRELQLLPQALLSWEFVIWRKRFHFLEL